MRQMEGFLESVTQEIGVLATFLDRVEGLRVVLKDRDFRYLYVSEGWVESTGLHDVLGKTVFDVFPVWRAEKYHREETAVMEERRVIDTFEELVMVEGGREQVWRSLKGPRWRDGKVIGMVIIGLLVDPEMVKRRLLDTRPEAVDWVERHAGDELTVAEIATQLGMSRRTLERYFQKKTGMSPQGYRTQCRIARARDLLRHSQRSLAEVAGECGFHDQSHFTRTFRQETDLTPGAWRKRYRETG